MRPMIFLLISILLFAPSAAWEIRGSIYPVEKGIVEWGQESFPGFNLRGSELLSLNISNAQIQAGHGSYKSDVQQKGFAHKQWGDYSTLSFSGQEFFIGYLEGCQMAEPLNLLSSGIGYLSRVLIDSDESHTIESDESLPLSDGYSLKFSDEEDGVKVELYKEGYLMDSQILLPPSDYIYKASIANENATCIAAGIKANVRLEPKSFYTIKGLFQISEDIKPIELGMEFGEMQVRKISDSGIELRNKNDLNVSRGQDFELMDGIRIKTSDLNAAFNQLYVYRNSTESDVSEVRGEIATGSFNWTPQNFAGFQYDMNSDLGDEKISTILTEGNKLVEPDGVVYATAAQPKDFQFRDWGQYGVMSFLGERFFVGYMNSSLLFNSQESALLANEKLSRILIDSNNPISIEDGANLKLEDGFEAKISVDKSCNSTLIELYKNGELVDRDYFKIPNTYTYEKMLTGLGDAITLLSIHILEADCSPTRSCIVDGIFQISEEVVNVSENTEYDKMTIQTVESNGIMMNNEDNDIILGKNSDIILAGDYRLRTIDGGALRYCICKPASA